MVRFVRCGLGAVPEGWVTIGWSCEATCGSSSERAAGIPPRRSRLHHRLPLLAFRRAADWGRTLRQGSVVLNETPERKGSRRALRYTVRAVVIGAAIILGACPRMITDSGYVLTVSPAAANVFVNDTTRFTATLRDKNGAAVSTPLSWSVDNTSIAQVDTTGTVHAMTAGSATIRVTGHAEVATAALTVVVDSGQTLTIAPTAASL